MESPDHDPQYTEKLEKARAAFEKATKQKDSQNNLGGIRLVEEPSTHSRDYLDESEHKIASNTEYKMCFIQGALNTDTGKEEYVFVLIAVDKLPQLEQVTKSNKPYELAEYGIIIESGTGVPPQALIDRMKLEYNFEV